MNNIIKAQVSDFYSELKEFQAKFKSLSDKIQEVQQNQSFEMKVLKAKVDMGNKLITETNLV